MQIIRWYPLLALGMLVVPIASRAQSTPAQGPQPKITEIATIPGVSVDEIVKMPNGHIFVFGEWDDQDEAYIASYDLTTKKITMITRGWDYDLAISPKGDRIAYARMSEDRKSDNLWTIPLDPATGKPTGPAQRMSTDQSDAPSFSPDGRWLAFSLGKRSTLKDSGHTQSLTVVPSTGGTPRVVVRYNNRNIQRTSWSADGKWIYVQISQVSPDRTYSIERVPSAGGRSDVLVSGPDIITGSIEDQVTFYRPTRIATGQFTYVTAAGGRGAFSGPAGSAFGESSGTLPPLMVSFSNRATLNLLNLENGKVLDRPFESANAKDVVWSPDQKRLALGAREGQNPEIIVMNADGSEQRHYAVKGDRPRPYWSPDGNTIVYFADSARQVRLLDLSTGVSRVLASGTQSTRFTNIVWQADGRAFRTIRFTFAPSTAAQFGSAMSILEIRLDGSTREVRDLSAEFPSTRVAFLASTRLAVVEFGDSVMSGATGFMVVPLDGGAARRVSLPTLDSGIRSGWVTGYSDQWFSVMLIARANNKVVGVAAMSTGTDSTRVSYLPADKLYFPGLHLVLPDGQIGMIGRTSGDKDFTLYAIPRDGTAPRVMARSTSMISQMSGWQPGLSPDGKQLAFLSPGPATTHVYDVDLTPILKLIKKP